MANLADGAQDERVLIVGKLGGRLPVVRHQVGAAVLGGELAACEHVGRTVVVHVGGLDGPLSVTALGGHLLVGGAHKVGAQANALVPDLLGVVVVHGVAHARGQVREDLPVVAALALGRNRGVKVLEATVRGSKDTLVLAPRGSGQDDVGKHGRLRHKDVLANEQIQLGERLAHAGRIGLGLHRVLAVVVEAVHLALIDQVTQVGEFVALLQGELFLGHAPSLGKLGAHGGVGDFLVARVQVGQHAHIAGALDVVLATHGRETGVGFADLAGNAGDGGDGVHRLQVLLLLAYAHAPANDGRGLRRGVHLGSLVDQRGLDTRDVLYGFGSVVLDGLPPLVKAVRVLGDELLVIEAIVDQAVGKGVEERHVATVLDRKVDVGDTRGFDMARVGDDDLATLFFGSHDTPCDDRVRIGRVIAEEEYAARILHTGDGARHAT